MNRRDALKALSGLLPARSARRLTSPRKGRIGRTKAPLAPISGAIEAASKVCSVRSQQSPIDIIGSIKAQLPPLRIAWGKTADTMVNNGHTIQLNAAKGSTLTFGGGSYRLLQFHFHRPSEHLIRGRSFPMEAHFVHAHASGALAVVGALMVAGKPNWYSARSSQPCQRMKVRPSRPTRLSTERTLAEATSLLSLCWLADDATLFRNGRMVAACRPHTGR